MTAQVRLENVLRENSQAQRPRGVWLHLPEVSSTAGSSEMEGTFMVAGACGEGQLRQGLSPGQWKCAVGEDSRPA